MKELRADNKFCRKTDCYCFCLAFLSFSFPVFRQLAVYRPTDGRQLAVCWLTDDQQTIDSRLTGAVLHNYPFIYLIHGIDSEYSSRS